jgi:hypothetical protein
MASPTKQPASRRRRSMTGSPSCAPPRPEETSNFKALIQRVILTADPRGSAERLRKLVPELSVDDILPTPYLWIGTVESICDHVLAAKERWGFSYFTVFHHSLEAATPIVTRLGRHLTDHLARGRHRHRTECKCITPRCRAGLGVPIGISGAVSTSSFRRVDRCGRSRARWFEKRAGDPNRHPPWRFRDVVVSPTWCFPRY